MNIRTTKSLQIPDGWRMVRLGDVARISFSTVDKKTKDGEQPVQLCNYTDVFYNRQIHAGMDFMRATANQRECEQWRLRHGDVLFTKDSETRTEIGIAAYVIEDLPEVLCGYHLGVARPNPKSIYGAYLARVFHSPDLSRQLARVANGVTRFGLTLGATRALTLPAPPIREQHAIAEVLDTIDDAIERTDELIAATERLRAALLHNLLTKGLPGLHAEWQQHPRLGTIPTGWRPVRLGEVTDINTKAWRPSQGGSIRYIDLTAVTGPGQMGPVRHLDAESAPSRARRLVRRGDTLISTVRPYLKCHARIRNASPNLVASTGFAVVTPRPSIHRSLVFYHAIGPHFTRHLEARMTGQAYPAVRPNDVASYTFALPPREEQEAIAKVLDSVDDAIDQTRGEKAGLAAFKESISDALLTGRVRVPVRT